MNVAAGERKALLIDAMGTLVALSPPAPRLSRELERRCGVSVSRSEAELALTAEIAYYRAHMQDGHDPPGVAALRRRCAETLRRALPAAAADLNLDVLTEVLLASLHFEPFPDARPALEQARSRGQQVIVLSNWDVTLPEVLARVGLREFVDGVVSSAAAGARKPDPAVFARALELAGVRPAQALHVGDSLEEDVAGGRASGIPVLWLNRAAASVPPGVTAIASLAELN
ncbi:MAG: HAD family hydrolase [Solirubrobacteraceae bacterium]